MPALLYGFALALVPAALAATVQSQPTPAADPIRIAFIDPLSGPYADAGHAAWKHFQAALEREQVVRQLGGRRMQVLAFDNRAGAVESVAQLQRAIDQGIRFVAHGQDTGVASALLEAIERHNARDPVRSVLLLNYGALDPALTNARCSFWHFRFDAHVDMRMKALVAVKAAEVRQGTYYVAHRDDAAGRAVAAAAREPLRALDPPGRAVGEEILPAGAIRERGATIARAKAAGAGAIISGDPGADLVLLVRAVRAGGFEGSLLTFRANAPGVVGAAGQALAGRLSQVSEWHPNVGLNDAKVLAAYAMAFRRTHGAEFRYPRILTLIDMLAVALQMHPDGDPRDVARALEGMRIRTPTGVATMRAQDHQLLQPLYVSTLHPAARNGGLLGVQYDTEGTGMGFATDRRIEAAATAIDSTCRMSRS